MIGEGDVIEVLVIVVGVEGAPAAILALQADHPLAAPADRLSKARRIRFAATGRPVHGHHHDGRIIQVRIVRIGVLERPPAGPHPRAPFGPVTFNIHHLQRLQPLQPLARLFHRFFPAHFQEGMAGQRRVPDR